LASLRDVAVAHAMNRLLLFNLYEPLSKVAMRQ